MKSEIHVLTICNKQIPGVNITNCDSVFMHYKGQRGIVASVLGELLGCGRGVNKFASCLIRPQDHI